MDARRALWIIVLAGSVAVSVGLAATGIGIAIGSALPQFALFAIAGGVALARPRMRSPTERRLAGCIELVGLFCWLSLIGSLASYLVAAGSIGFHDRELAAIDAWLGFDWLRAYHQVAERPWLAQAAGLAYRSIFVSPLIVICGLVWTGREARATRFVLSVAAALVVALAIFHLWPARSALAYYVGTDAAYMPATGIAHVALIEGLQAGTVTMVDTARIVGMITVPSFHAVCAILFIWAAWPVRGLRWPVLAVNLAMIAVTPVEGTHYLADVIAGVALALVVIALGGVIPYARARRVAPPHSRVAVT